MSIGASKGSIQKQVIDCADVAYEHGNANKIRYSDSENEIVERHRE